MNCDRVQELLLTDYLDGQLTPEELKPIEGHLINCPKCREFLSEARRVSAEPFLGSPKIFLSPESRESVWHKIKEQIEAENPQLQSGVSKPEESFISLFRYLAAAAVVILMMVVYFRPFNQQEIAQPVFTEDEEVSDYVIKELFVSQADDNGDYGTMIEEYFL